MALGLVPVSSIIFTFLILPMVAFTMIRLSLYSPNGISVSLADWPSVPSLVLGEDDATHKKPGKLTRSVIILTNIPSLQQSRRLVPMIMSPSSADCAVRATLGFRADYLNARALH